MEKLEVIPDPTKACKCGSLYHWCSEDRQSGRTPGGDVYKGCFGRSNGAHPKDGAWWVCLFCGNRESAL